MSGSRCDALARMVPTVCRLVAFASEIYGCALSRDGLLTLG